MAGCFEKIGSKVHTLAYVVFLFIARFSKMEMDIKGPGFWLT